MLPLNFTLNLHVTSTTSQFVYLFSKLRINSKIKTFKNQDKKVGKTTFYGSKYNFTSHNNRYSNFGTLSKYIGKRRPLKGPLKELADRDFANPLWYISNFNNCHSVFSNVFFLTICLSSGISDSP